MAGMSNASGILYVVATPIGNLSDISRRAVEILGEVDLVAAEDTRHTKKLLDALNIHAPAMLSLHEHNERERLDHLLALLQEGRRIALVSDAGTPLISDPGFPLVARCREHGVKVVPVPGPSAVITALSVSGLPTDRFLFEGFLPRTASKRQARLDLLRDFSSTMVFYESSHRILQTLTDMQHLFGEDRQAVMARELTKAFETVVPGTLARLVEIVTADPNQQRGEFVVMVAGAEARPEMVEAEARRVLDAFADELSPNRLAKVVAKLYGGNKRDYYQYLLEKK
jgi:16S rRNA (cytidine1402-2'-O)-methyltransferase